MEENISSPLEDLKAIKNAITHNTVESSLSGTGFLVAGIITLTGFIYGIFFRKNISEINTFLLVTIILGLSLLSIFVFTFIRSKKTNKKFVQASTKKLFLNFSLPFVVLSLFLLYLLILAYFSANWQFQWLVIRLSAGFSLIIYGISLFSARKNMHKLFEILAYCEIALGLIALFPTYMFAWFIWAFGFGILHIVLGIVLILRVNNQESRTKTFCAKCKTQTAKYK